MAVSGQAIQDLRDDLGDTTKAFSETELERLLERSADSTGAPRHFVALAMGLFQLINQAARFATYTVNEAQERRGEIANNLRGSLDLLMQRPDVKEALGSDSGGSIQTRKMKYTRTRGQYGEYAFPDLVGRGY